MLPNHIMFQQISAEVTETFRDLKWWWCLKWSQNVIHTISRGSLFDPCWKRSVASWGCSRSMWQRVSSLGPKCLAAAIIQAGERSATAPVDIWSSDTQPNTALVNTCAWHKKSRLFGCSQKYVSSICDIMVFIPWAHPWTWSSKKAAESLAGSGGHIPISPHLRDSVGGSPACCCWRCSQTGESSLCHALLLLKISYKSQKKTIWNHTIQYCTYFMISPRV